MAIHRNRKTARCGAFTLVEMLVVIGIISALAALLLPTLDASLLRARIVACAGNHRQTGAGMLMFETDLRRLPRVLTSYGRDAWTGIWIDSVLTAEPLAGYLPDADVYEWLSPSGTGTQYTANCTATCQSTRVALHRLCHTPRTMGMIQNAWFARYPLLSCREEMHYDSGNGIFDWERGAHLDAGAVCGSNLFFLDGHVAWRGLVRPWGNGPYCTDAGNHAERSGLWMYANTSGYVERTMPDEMFGINPSTMYSVIAAGTVSASSTSVPSWYR